MTDVSGDSVYYNPERYGLVEVYECDVADSYEFDKFVVWFMPQTSELFWGSDSGCSCPSPFENETWPGDFGNSPFETLDPLDQALRTWIEDSSYSDEAKKVNVIEVMQTVRWKVASWWMNNR
jgi:hypothetical protein